MTASRKTVVVQEVIKDCCWEIRQLLTQDECGTIREEGISKGIQTAVATGDVRYRNNCTVDIHDETLATTLWQRLEPFVPQEYVIHDHDDEQDEDDDGGGNNNLPPGFSKNSEGSKQKTRQYAGTWRPYGVNPDCLLLYYQTGGHFGPHRDAFRVLSEHERSMLTVAMYLNDRPPNHGGATNFLKDDIMKNDDMNNNDRPFYDDKGRIRSPQDCIVAQVQSDEAGKAVVFVHDLMHEGEPLQVQRNDDDGSIDNDNDDDEKSQEEVVPKWLLITQVLYRRDPQSAPTLTNDQIQARRVLKDAEEAEVRGNVMEAIKLYKKAYKLDPSLE